MRGKIIAGGFVALLVSSSAFATTVALSPAPPATSISISTETGDFTDYYTFTLATTADLRAVDSVTPATGTFTSGELELFSGSPTTGTLVSEVALTGTPVPSGSLRDVLGAGTYYYGVTAAVTPPSGLSVNVLTLSAVPELGTWAMMALGFIALGYAAFRREAKGQSDATAI